MLFKAWLTPMHLVHFQFCRNTLQQGDQMSPDWPHLSLDHVRPGIVPSRLVVGAWQLGYVTVWVDWPVGGPLSRAGWTGQQVRERTFVSARMSGSSVLCKLTHSGKEHFCTGHFLYLLLCTSSGHRAGHVLTDDLGPYYNFLAHLLLSPPVRHVSQQLHHCEAARELQREAVGGGFAERGSCGEVGGVVKRCQLAMLIHEHPKGTALWPHMHGGPCSSPCPITVETALQKEGSSRF